MWKIESCIYAIPGSPEPQMGSSSNWPRGCSSAVRAPIILLPDQSPEGTGAGLAGGSVTTGHCTQGCRFGSRGKLLTSNTPLQHGIATLPEMFQGTRGPRGPSAAVLYTSQDVLRLFEMTPWIMGLQLLLGKK